MQHKVKSNFRLPLFSVSIVVCFLLTQMSCNGSDQLEKALEEVLDDEEVKVEKSCVEKMEKQREPESRVLETQPAGIVSDSRFDDQLFSTS